MRPIDKYDEELARMHDLVLDGFSVDTAAVTIGISAGVPSDRLAHLYPAWAALASIPMNGGAL